MLAVLNCISNQRVPIVLHYVMRMLLGIYNRSSKIFFVRGKWSPILLGVVVL